MDFGHPEIWYPKLDFGYLEEMYGGIGGEVLYRPFNKRYALGLVAHKVKQRELVLCLTFFV